MAVPARSFDEALLSGSLARLDQLEADGVLTPVITLDRLWEFLDDGQRVLVEQVIGLRPSDYGVDTPYAGDLEPVPSDLVTVSGQQYTEHGGQRTLGDQYVPRHVFEKYTALNDAFTGEHPGRRLLIQSCYRSPAYQVAVFVRWLVTRYQATSGRLSGTPRHRHTPSTPAQARRPSTSRTSTGRRPIPTRATSHAPPSTPGCRSTQPGSGSTSPGHRATSTACGPSRGTGSTGRCRTSNPA